MRDAERTIMRHPIPHSPFSDVTLIEAINSVSAKLAAAGIANARLDAEVLLCHTLGKDRAWLLAHMPDALGDEDLRLFEQTGKRRAAREPLQYITGKQEFWGLEFLVTPDVLIPRPETELILESIARPGEDRNRLLRIIDLCTGSGCIAVSLAKELPQARILATDKSSRALSIAGENARRHGVADSIRFFEGDLFVPLEELDIHGQVDIIAANPPYVPSVDYGTLQPEVRDYEPEMALFAGPDGTEVHRRILEEAPAFLKKHGMLIMEMGAGQADMLVQMARQAGSYHPPEILKDLAGIDRVITMKKK
jgi:release factor glutamine methyltransferase